MRGNQAAERRDSKANGVKRRATPEFRAGNVASQRGLPQDQCAERQIEQHPACSSRRIGALGEAEGQMRKHGVDGHRQRETGQGEPKASILGTKCDADGGDPDHQADQRCQKPKDGRIGDKPELDVGAQPSGQE